MGITGHFLKYCSEVGRGKNEKKKLSSVNFPYVSNSLFLILIPNCLKTIWDVAHSNFYHDLGEIMEITFQKHPKWIFPSLQIISKFIMIIQKYSPAGQITATASLNIFQHFKRFVLVHPSIFPQNYLKIRKKPSKILSRRGRKNPWSISICTNILYFIPQSFLHTSLRFTGSYDR